MRFFQKIKKKIALLILISVLGFQFFTVNPRRSEAIPVVDAVLAEMQLEERIEKMVMSILTTALRSLMTKTLANRAGASVSAIVGDWADYLRQSGYDVSLDWLDEKFFNSQLCSHIRPQIQLPLINLAEGKDEFKADCSLTKFIDEVSETFDYLESGDWLVFEEVLVPQNNEVGLYLEASSEILAIQAETKEIELAQLEANEGWTSTKDENGKIVQTGKTKADAWKSIYIDLPIGNIIALDPDEGFSGMMQSLLQWGVDLLLTNVFEKGKTWAENVGDDI